MCLIPLINLVRELLWTFETAFINLIIHFPFLSENASLHTRGWAQSFLLLLLPPPPHGRQPPGCRSASLSLLVGRCVPTFSILFPLSFFSFQFWLRSLPFSRWASGPTRRPWAALWRSLGSCPPRPRRAWGGTCGGRAWACSRSWPSCGPCGGLWPRASSGPRLLLLNGCHGGISSFPFWNITVL